jgi:glycosyltransferase involved in cell wall biosynthesis
MTDLMVKAGVAPREKFVTVFSGMDVEPFLHADGQRAEMRRRFDYPPDVVVVGKIARLFHLKGHPYLIAAAERVVQQCPWVRFLLIGDGILREALERQIARAGLTDFFRFVGLVQPEEIPGFLGAMDVLVHTSLREGLARALPQALVAGKPVVSYDVDGAREVVIPGETGFLVPPTTVAQLADALIQLAQDGQLRQSCGSRGRERFTEAFRHERMTERLREIYERILRYGHL